MSVKGADLVAKALRALANVPNTAQARAARTKALKPIVDDAKANLSANGSVESGKLRRAMGTGQKDRNTTAAGPRKGLPHTNVAHLVEFGTAPHWQPRRNGGQMHPGARPKPFLRPAFEEHKGMVMEMLGKEVVAVIEKAANGSRKR